MNALAAALAFGLAASASAGAESLSRAARSLSAASRAAGVETVAVASFHVDEDGDLGAGREAAERFVTSLAQDHRLVLLEREALPALAGARGLRAAAAILTGDVYARGARRRVLARIIDARTGVIVAAAQADFDEETPAVSAPKAIAADDDFPYGRLFDRATALLASAESGDNWSRADFLLERLAAPGLTASERASAALAMSRLGDARTAAALSRGLHDGAPAVRAACALALGLRADPAGRDRVSWAQRTDADARVRRAAALALSRGNSAGLSVF
jgi:TolB-like protein